MRWQSGLRECVKWMEEIEVTQRQHYDFVMRLREDTYVFSKFYLSPKGYANKLSSLGMNGYGGINDHNLIVDRIHADKMFRGMTEDYYFQTGEHSSHGYFWGTPENLIKRMTMFYGVETSLKSICLFPFATIFARINHTHFDMRAYGNNGIHKRFLEKCKKRIKFSTIIITVFLHLRHGFRCTTIGKPRQGTFNLSRNFAPLLEPDLSVAEIQASIKLPNRSS